MQKRPRKRGRPGTISTPEHLERQIVVGILECAREVLEIPPGTRRACLGPSCCRRPASSAAFSVEISPTRATTAAQHHQLANVDLGAVAGLVLLVLALAILDPTLDVDPVSLLIVFFVD